MSVISGVSRNVKTLADGTLRLSIDISPTEAQEAFALFGAPNVPIALARLTQEASIASAQADTIASDKPKGGALSKWAAMRCADPIFREWLELDPNNAAQNESGAIRCVYAICGIDSRAELDNDPVAKEKFDRLIRLPYAEWIKMQHENEVQPF